MDAATHMQRRMEFEFVDALMMIKGQSPYHTAQYLAYLVICKNSAIMGRLKELGNKNM